MQWENMTPKERDELVAEKVMGWQKRDGEWYKTKDTGEEVRIDPPCYSSDPTLAFEILEQFSAYQVTKMFPPKFRTIIEEIDYCAYAQNMTESICKAALMAKKIDL